MKKILLMLVAVSVVIGLALIIGCSDDDDESKPTGPVAGDPNDPEFMMVSDIISNGIIDNDVILLQLASLLALNTAKDDQPFPFKVTAPDQTLDSLDFVYDYSEFWHIFDVYARLIDAESTPPDTLIYVGIDSIRFFNLEGPVADYNSAIGMDIHSHFNVDVYFDGGTAMIISDAAFTITATGIYTAVITGTSSDSLYMMFVEADTACELSMSSTQTATDLIVNSGEIDCPAAGSIVVDAGVDISCVTDSASMDYASSWHVVAAFSGGTVTVTYTSGNTFWTVTEPCATAKRQSGIAGAARRVGEQL